ncbi:MAG TPA: DUF3179 domain-containing protein [Caldithrix abyssi]|uniref:DUF3179 domain-containing protein n=1 Tax=Caldithrix abyssi TaxID=187145 RepID=A0A7V5RN87_CALAY|nr:DUF3179 domain-containing protein [Caldithrix abyssi]
MRFLFLLTVYTTALSAQTDFELFLDLLRDDEEKKLAAVETIVNGNDTSRWAALVDLLYFRALPAEAHELMNRAASVDYGRNWPRWMEWIALQSQPAGREYRRFKQLLFSQIDPAFSAFLNPSLPTEIRWEEIAWGGVKKDGIRSLDNPPMESAAEADYLQDSEPVFGVYINGEAMAFPLRILDWHEMANVRIGGEPVALSYCTLCGAAIAYLARFNGTVYSFGSSGLLYRSNKLMYDRQTNSLWSAMKGIPVTGILAGRGVKLSTFPVERTRWRDWRERHPGTRVLSDNTGLRSVYKRYSGYYRYFNSPGLMFPVAQRDNRLPAKSWVYGLSHRGRFKAWPLPRLEARPVLNDSLAGTGFVLLSDPGALSVRVYLSGGENFSAVDDQTLKDREGRLWQIRDSALVAPDGESLPRYPGHLAYWFAWYAFFPETELYDGADPDKPGD